MSENQGNSNSGNPKVLQFHRSSARPKAISSFESDGFAADIFHNPELHPPTWHYIVTRLDNSEILYWGQERSLQRAEHAAHSTLQILVAKAEVS